MTWKIEFFSEKVKKPESPKKRTGHSKSQDEGG
jgi:hypothetical protein